MFVNISTLSFLQQLLSTFPRAEAKESKSIGKLKAKEKQMKNDVFTVQSFLLVNLPISELNNSFLVTT